MRGIYGSMLNVLYLMLNRTLLVALVLTAGTVGAYIIGGVAPARNLSQLLVLVFIPMLTVWTARISYSSKWNIFEQNWSASPVIMIVSRYILFALINLIVSVVWYFSPLYDDNFWNLVHTMGSAYLTLAIYYPIMYMLRGEKGETDQLIFILAISGSIFGSAWLGMRFGQSFMVMLFVSAYIISLGLPIVFSSLHKGRAA